MPSKFHKQVVNLSIAGESSDAISDILGIPVSRVESIIRRQVLYDKVKSMMEDGASIPDIMEECHVSYKVLSCIRKEIGLTLKRTGEDVSALTKNYRKLLSQNPGIKAIDAASIIGVPVSHIIYIRQKKNISKRRGKKYKERIKKRILKELEKNQAYTLAELSSILNVPKSSVRTYVNELGIKRDKNQSYNILFISIGQQVKELVLKSGHNMTDAQLADRIGISVGTLYRWLKKLGLPTGKKRRQKNLHPYFKKMWDDGWSDTEIADAMGCCHQLVNLWRSRNNLVMNTIHLGLNKGSHYLVYTPATLLDIIGSPMGSAKLDKIFAFASLGATRSWLKKRFAEVTWIDINAVCDQVLSWEFPKNLSAYIRRKQLRESNNES